MAGPALEWLLAWCDRVTIRSLPQALRVAEKELGRGKPDIAAVADEELPERVTADFKTTVDRTEWRG